MIRCVYFLFGSGVSEICYFFVFFLFFKRFFIVNKLVNENLHGSASICPCELWATGTGGWDLSLTDAAKDDIAEVINFNANELPIGFVNSI